jgi:penicillin-binding protein 1A
MLLATALAQSKNTVSVKLVDALGVDAVMGFARRAGITSDLPRNLTLALGTGEVAPLELVNGYTTIAAGGSVADPVLVLRVRDRHGNVLEEAKTATAATAVPTTAATATADDGTFEGEPVTAAPEFTIPEQGTRADVAYVLTGMMRGVVESGTGLAAKALGRPVAAKTGTAQEHRDAWFVGFTPELVAGVWVGFDDHAPLGPRETGAGAALPPWLSFMQAALGARPPQEFPVPPGIELARIDPATGLLAGDGRPDAPFLAFLAGTAPTETAEANPGSAPANFFMDDR